MRQVIFVSFLLIYPGLFAQSLEPARRVDWSGAGKQTADWGYVQSIDFVQAGGIADGLSPNDSVFQRILQAVEGLPSRIYFPPGNYLFTEPLVLPDELLLQGAGAGETQLLFDLKRPDHLIQIRGEPGRDTVWLAEDAFKGNSYLILEDEHSYQAGVLLRLFDADQARVYSTWAHYTTGQLVQVVAVQQDTVWLNEALRRSYHKEEQPRVIAFTPRQQVGIEQLAIRRLDKTATQTSNILFEYAANCRVSCISSLKCNFAHVEIRNSLFLEVSGSHFAQAFDYGNGGKAYGVMLHFTSGSNLIQDNTFHTLRHALILQAGANGNVLAYNYSQNPYWTGVSLPTNSAGDLVLHGNYPYANLLEGNVVQNLIIDDSHGRNGPFNTFFRNRVELYGIFMNNDPASDEQHFIGNEVPNMATFYGNYYLSGRNHIEVANHVRGVVVPAGEPILADSSFYLQEIPPFYLKQSAWPPIGFPHDLNQYSIQAQERVRQGLLTACDTLVVVRTGITGGFVEQEIRVFPNPSRQLLMVKVPTPDLAELTLRLYDTQDRELIVLRQQSQMAIGHLPPGLYLLQIQLHGQVVKVEKIVIE